MIVHPHFLDHWKVRALSERLGDRLSAIQAMLRIWGHCQEMKEWVFKLDAWKLASICRDWAGSSDVLWGAVTDPSIRVLDDVGDGNWEVHEWAQENASLTSAWSKGGKGGKKSAELRRLRQAGVEAQVLPIGLDRIGRDGRDGIEAEVLPEVEFPSGFPDTAERAVEMVTNARPEIAAEWIKFVWSSLIGVGFKDGSGRLVTNWAHYIAGRWPKDGERWWADWQKNKTAGPKSNVKGIRPPLEGCPWRLVLHEKFGYTPTLPWDQQTSNDRNKVRDTWGALSDAERFALVEKASREDFE